LERKGHAGVMTYCGEGHSATNLRKKKTGESRKKRGMPWEEKSRGAVRGQKKTRGLRKISKPRGKRGNESKK